MTKVAELKTENTEKIRRCFYDCRIWTKNALSRQTGISLSGTTNVLQELLEKKEIVQIDDACSTGGRKSKQYLLNRDHCHIAKLILKKTEHAYIFIITVTDLFSKVIDEKEKKTDKGTFNDLRDCLKIIAAEKDIGVLTISIPGVSQNGVIQTCDFYELEGKNIGELIREYTDVPYVIENDVNVAVIGFKEQYPSCKNMALLYQPACDYFGCGILIDGKLYNGYSHSAGELRYLPDLSEEEQLKKLKEDPKGLLEDRIRILQAVLDPEFIGWYSDVIKEDIDFGTHVKKVEGLYECIQNGLYQIGISQIKTGGK